MNKILCILLMAPFSLLTAQVLQSWVGIYNGPGNSTDLSRSMVLDGSGNIYVTGGSFGNGTHSDFVTIKYISSSSVPQWVQRYNGPANDNDFANAITMDNFGNVCVTGSSRIGNFYTAVATVKYNSAGNLYWVARYCSPDTLGDNGVSICADNNGNVYVSGTSWSYYGSTDCLTIKYNTSGVIQWVKRYNAPGNTYDEPRASIIDNLNNIYITGSSGSNGYPTRLFLIKYDSSGLLQWVRTYSGPANMQDCGYSIDVDDSGNIFVAGESAGVDTTLDYVTISFSTSGVLRWVQRYNGPANEDDRAFSLILDRSGNIYVTGRSTGVGSNYDYCTIKYNFNGAQQWVKRYNGPGNNMDIANSIAVDSLGDVYVTGNSMSSSVFGSFDFATIKYNSEGLEKWVQRYNGTGNIDDHAWVIAIDGLENVFINGEAGGGGSYLDITTIKYTQPIGIRHISSEIPKAFNLYQNYPNPFNPITKIKFALPPSPKGEGLLVRVIIYDILGREIATLVNEQLQPGTYEVEWNAMNYPSGVYYYKLITYSSDRLERSDGYHLTKKMLLIK